MPWRSCNFAKITLVIRQEFASAAPFVRSRNFVLCNREWKEDDALRGRETNMLCILEFPLKLGAFALRVQAPAPANDACICILRFTQLVSFFFLLSFRSERNTIVSHIHPNESVHRVALPPPPPQFFPRVTEIAVPRRVFRRETSLLLKREGS